MFHLRSPRNLENDLNNNAEKSKMIVTSFSSPSEKCRKTFKERWTFAARKQESTFVMIKFPRKLPVIVEKFSKESDLPYLDKTKFLVPDDWSISQFMFVVRNRLRLKSTQAFYMMVSNRCITSLSRTVAEVYWEYKDVDGFLYLSYTAQEMYGAPFSDRGRYLIRTDGIKSN